MGEAIFYIFGIIAILFFWGRKGEDNYGEIKMTDYKLRDINTYTKNWGK